VQVPPRADALLLVRPTDLSLSCEPPRTPAATRRGRCRD